MSIASFNDYQVQITRLLDGEDVSVSNVTTDTLLQIINLAERRIYRDVRSRFNEKAFSAVTTTDSLAAIPSDFEAASVLHFGKKALEPVSEGWMMEYNECEPTGDCLYFCEAGTSFMFAPAVADGTALEGRYFYRLPDLDGTTFAANTFIAREPDLFIYAALVEAVPFFPRSAAHAAAWMERYTAIKDRLNSDRKRASSEGGRIRRRPSTRLMG